MITLISIPGLEESLNLNELTKGIKKKENIFDIQLKDSIEIEGNTTDFQVPYIALVGTVINEELDGLDEVESISDIKDKINKL